MVLIKKHLLKTKTQQFLTLLILTSCQNLIPKEIKKALPLSMIDDDGPDHGLIHPEKANSWETKKLLFSYNTYKEEDLQNCLINIETLTENAKKEEDLIEIRNFLLRNISPEIHIYHWCFYYKMSKLDEKLRSIDTSLEEKQDLFLSGMLNLWLLGISLDILQDAKVYFPYLRSRYIGISKKIFGSRLEVSFPSLTEYYKVEDILNENEDGNENGNEENENENRDN